MSSRRSEGLYTAGTPQHVERPCPTIKGDGLKLLLTSGGIKNTSIRDALVELLGKPIAESTALFIPTAIYPFPGGAGMAWKAISGNSLNPLCDLGWKSLGVLELTRCRRSSARAGFPCSVRPTP